MKKLLPLILLLLGSGAGVGAGIFLRPPPVEEEAHAEDGGEEHGKEDTHADAEHAAEDGSDAPSEEGEMEYVKLNNQFVVPIVKDRAVVALVVMALSLEVPVGNKDSVFQREPKVRDSFLRVLFDHANIGGFEGAFTDASNLDVLRAALREVAKRDLGKDTVNDVLIMEIARQDY